MPRKRTAERQSSEVRRPSARMPERRANAAQARVRIFIEFRRDGRGLSPKFCHGFNGSHGAGFANEKEMRSR